MWSSEPCRTRRGALALLPLLGLAACGFQLRRVADLQFQSIALTGFVPRSTLAEELRTVLERTVELKDAPEQAQVILQALSEERLRRVVIGRRSSGQIVRITRLGRQTPRMKRAITCCKPMAGLCSVSAQGVRRLF